MFQKELLGSTCFFLLGSEPHIQLLTCHEELQEQSIPGLDAWALVLCLHTEQKLTVCVCQGKELQAKLSGGEDKTRENPPVPLQESRLLTAVTPPSRDDPLFSLAM